MFRLPTLLQQLFKKKRGEDNHAYECDVIVPQLSELDVQTEQVMEVQVVGENQTNEKTSSQEFEIYPEDPAVRKQWFSLTIRERQVVALVCMGHRNYEIASILGVGYPTVQTHLQNIFRKFDLRSRQEIRAALLSWPAEEWWNYHHY
jgi:DNA-binding CsgD family transcriptional regulator